MTNDYHKFIKIVRLENSKLYYASTLIPIRKLNPKLTKTKDESRFKLI